MTLLELTLETAINEAGEFKDVRLSKEDAEYVLSMLKEQEAVEPTDIGYEINVPYPYRCGKCKRHIRKGQKYCDMCGRKVKWNGSD